VKIGLAIIVFLAAVLGVVFATLYGQIGNVRVEVESTKARLSAINDRLGRIEQTVNDRLSRIEQTVEGMHANERQNLNRPARDEQPTVSVTPNLVGGFYVTEQEARFIRAFLKVAPKKVNATAKMALWARMPAQATKLLPDDLVGKVAKLKGLRYAVDANNAIALIEPSTNIIIALI